MSSESWNGHVNTLYNVHKNELQNNLQVAQTKLRKKLGHETDDVIDVAVTYDGTWSKRGHTATFGFAFVISVDTGEAFDLDFMSKLCWECNNQNMVKDSEEFQQWFDTHRNYCSKNYDGTSGNMEIQIAKDVWARSLDFGLRYKYMVCGGDSRAYNSGP